MQNNVDETIEQLRAKNIEVVGTAANVSKIADVKRLVELAVSSYGRVDIVVSNAAVNPFAGAILNTPDWAIDKLFEVNVKSAIQLLREIRPHMPQVSSLSTWLMRPIYFAAKTDKWLVKRTISWDAIRLRYVVVCWRS